ncbi:unnamed protein product [Camellia sinensis]
MNSTSKSHLTHEPYTVDSLRFFSKKNNNKKKNQTTQTILISRFLCFGLVNFMEGEPVKHVYSVWAIPPEDVRERLKKLMLALRSEFGGPEFEPHITVVGAISLTEDDALDKFRAACHGVKPYTATVEKVATGTFFYQCVFLLLHPTPEGCLNLLLVRHSGTSSKVLSLEGILGEHYTPALPEGWGDSEDIVRQLHLGLDQLMGRPIYLQAALDNLAYLSWRQSRAYTRGRYLVTTHVVGLAPALDYHHYIVGPLPPSYVERGGTVFPDDYILTDVPNPLDIINV